MTNNKSNQRKPQLEDIAEALGISKSTVSRAISGKGRIRAETREKVFACIKEMNYRPNMIAKSLSERRTYNIGVVVPMDQNEMEAPFFQTCLNGIAKECAVHDYDAVLIGTEKDNLSQLQRVIQNRKVDGVIVTRPASDGSIEELLDSSDMPFVVVGRSVHSNSIIIDSDHVNGCKALTSYLLLANPPEKLGLILGNMEHTVNKSRYAGFMSAFSGAEQHIDERLLFTGVDSDLKFSKAVALLLKEKPSCIICGDDVICMKLLTLLNEKGIAIPSQMRVASFYDSVYLDSCSPPVTSLYFDAAKLGSASADRLIDLLTDTEAEDTVSLVFELLIRGSTL